MSRFLSNKDLGLNQYGIKQQDRQSSYKKMQKVGDGIYNVLRGGCLDRLGRYRMEIKVGKIGCICLHLGLRRFCIDGQIQNGEVVDVEFEYNEENRMMPRIEVIGMLGQDWAGQIVYLGEVK